MPPRVSRQTETRPPTLSFAGQSFGSTPTAEGSSRATATLLDAATRQALPAEAQRVESPDKPPVDCLFPFTDLSVPPTMPGSSATSIEERYGVNECCRWKVRLVGFNGRATSRPTNRVSRCRSASVTGIEAETMIACPSSSEIHPRSKATSQRTQATRTLVTSRRSSSDTALSA